MNLCFVIWLMSSLVCLFVMDGLCVLLRALLVRVVFVSCSVVLCCFGALICVC